MGLNLPDINDIIFNRKNNQQNNVNNPIGSALGNVPSLLSAGDRFANYLRGTFNPIKKPINNPINTELRAPDRKPVVNLSGIDSFNNIAQNINTAPNDIAANQNGIGGALNSLANGTNNSFANGQQFANWIKGL